MKELIIQTLAMVSEQERNESKRRQAQGIQIAKEEMTYSQMLKIHRNVLFIIAL